jgi:hypothetical protein
MQTNQLEMSQADVSTYVFSYPLVLLAITQAYDFALSDPNQRRYNVILHRQEKIINSTFETVVVPNVNLLYSDAWIQLPIQIRAPSSPNRFALLSVLNSFGNVIWKTRLDQHEEDLNVTLDASEYPDAMWFISRIAISSDEKEEDMQQAQELQSQVQLTGDTSAYIPSKYVPSDGSSSPFLLMMNIQPRRFYLIAQEMLQRLSHAPRGTLDQLDKILARKDEAIQTNPNLLCCPENVFALQSTSTNGWYYSPFLGRYGQDIMLTAFAARWLVAANQEEDARYYLRFDLDPTHSYELSLDDPPAIQKVGFWSLTTYNQNTGTLWNNTSNLLFTNSSSLPAPTVLGIQGTTKKGFSGQVFVIFRIYGASPNVPLDWFPPRLRMVSRTQTEYVITL